MPVIMYDPCVAEAISMALGELLWYSSQHREGDQCATTCGCQCARVCLSHFTLEGVCVTPQLKNLDSRARPPAFSTTLDIS